MGCRLGWDQQCVALPGVEASVKEMEEKAYTVCYLCVDMLLVTIFGIADATRQEAHEAVKALQGLGVEPVMITGDQKRAAEAVARTRSMQCRASSAKAWWVWWATASMTPPPSRCL